MKTLTILFTVLLATTAFAEDKFHPQDRIVSKQIISETADDVNTPTPEELEGATIIVKTKDGKTHKMSANKFKVVKRQQQFKNKKTVILEHADCPPKVVEVVKTQVVTRTIVKKAPENLNFVALGVRYDYTHLDSSVSGNTATIEARRATVFDLSYTRRRLFDTRFGAGASIDTNGTPRVFGGVEF